MRTILNRLKIESKTYNKKSYLTKKFKRNTRPRMLRKKIAVLLRQVIRQMVAEHKILDSKTSHEAQLPK